MFSLLIAILINTALLYVTSRVVPGVFFQGGLVSLLLAGTAISVFNMVLQFVFGRIRFLRLLFSNLIGYFLLNTLLLLAAAKFVSAFHVRGFLPPLLGGVVFGVFNLLVFVFLARGRRTR